MYIKHDNGKIASTLFDDYIGDISEESIKDLISFKDMVSADFMLTNLQDGSYNVRKYDKEITSYFKSFKSLKSLYVDLMLKGGAITFGNAVRLKYWKLGFLKGIKLEDIEVFSPQWLTDLGYECVYEAGGVSKYTYKGCYTVVKTFDVQSGSIILSFNFGSIDSEVEAIGSIEIISGSSCILSLPFYMDDVGEFNANICGVNMYSVPQLIKTFFEIQTNSEKASSYVPIKEDVVLSIDGVLYNIVITYNLAYRVLERTSNVISEEDEKYSEYLEQAVILSDEKLIKCLTEYISIE